MELARQIVLRRLAKLVGFTCSTSCESLSRTGLLRNKEAKRPGLLERVLSRSPLGWRKALTWAVTDT